MIIQGSDTLFCVSVKNLRSNNNAIADLKACNEMADTLFAERERYKSISEDKSKELFVSDSLNKNKDQQIAEKIITEASYKKGEERNKVKGKLLKGTSIGLAVIVLVETGWIALTNLFK